MKIKQNLHRKQHEVSIASTPLFSIYFHRGTGPFSIHRQHPKNLPVVLFLVFRGHAIFVKTGISSLPVQLGPNSYQLFFEKGINPKVFFNGPEKWEFFEIRLSENLLDELPASVSSLWDIFMKKVAKRNPAILSNSSLYYGSILQDISYSLLSKQFGEPMLQEKYFDIKIKEILLHLVHELVFQNEKKVWVNNKYHMLVSKVKQILGKSKTNRDFTLQTIAESLDTNETTLKQAFKKVTGISIYQYYLQKQMMIAQQLLHEGHPVTEVALKVGYSTIGHFSHRFKEHFGVSPKNFSIKLKND